MPKKNSKDLKLLQNLNKQTNRSHTSVNMQHTLLFKIVKSILSIVLLIVVYYGVLITIASSCGGVW